MMIWFLVACMSIPTESNGSCRVDTDVVNGITTERITGSLSIAESEVRSFLSCPDVDAELRVALQLELARILDRIGLHTNTRPVVEALEILREAEASVAADDVEARARISLAFAEYFYRAEMGEREFPAAEEHAQRARMLYAELDDPVGEADAVHRLGLIALQQRRLGDARELFDRSLELSNQGPVRPIFLSDYHRHIGFVDILEDDLPAAVAHFEQSLAFRDEAGSRDYGLFARTLLGSALIRAGRPEEAARPLEQAYEIARDLPSPVGELRAGFNLGRMHEALEAYGEALCWYQRATELATVLGEEDVRRSASDGEQRMLTLIGGE